MPVYNYYYELPVYKVCRDFRKKVAAAARKFFPKTEEYLLKSQLLDACRSVTANIAEGFGRYHYQENIQFCRQARGSLDETHEHLVTAFDDKYITKEILAENNKLYRECRKQLNMYIKYLKTAKLEDTNNK